MFGTVGRNECCMDHCPVPFNEEKYVIIACKDLVIMTPNYIGRRIVFNSI